MEPLATQQSPTSLLIAWHYLIGSSILLLSTALLIFFPEALTQHYFNPKLLAITHLFVLGWITMIIVGTLYQLIPVILEVKLYSEVLGYIACGFLTIGTVGLSTSFWNFWLGIPIQLSGFFIIVAVLLFGVNIFKTAYKSPLQSIEKEFILASIVWLLFTVIAGLLLAINLSNPFMDAPHLELLKLHSHAGIIGWILLLIIGVSSKILPMFMLSKTQDKKLLKWSFYLINGSLVGSILSIYYQINYITTTLIAAGILGVVCFMLYQYNSYSSRIRRKLDIGMKQSYISFLLLGVAVLFIIYICWTNKPSTAMLITYVTLLIIGFITSLIMGQTYKIVPFIIWLAVYNELAGKTKLPALNTLYSQKIACIQVWAFTFGYLTLALGIVLSTNSIIQGGALIMTAAIVLYKLNLYKIVTHKPSFNV